MLINQQWRPQWGLKLPFNRVTIKGKKHAGAVAPAWAAERNWRLVMAPPPVVDYIVIRRHLIEATIPKILGHSECLSYQTCRDWIK